ncbi:MFS general substrate transporter [Coprinopsis marcescibilis]|uniref:MFS general substrate transporter n=1 Tax=Coprinopsis marcescibilis TaxID=230819 RepID=A0A5C3KW49_COPMA|nr:MFS general substrate transporter [Coprinopsis marcescibilis]
MPGHSAGSPAYDGSPKDGDLDDIAIGLGSPVVAPLSQAYIPDHLKLNTSSHYNLNDSSPSTPTPFSDRSFSLDTEKERDGSTKQERVILRIGAGYLVYFLCGWGDGVTATVLPYFMEEFKVTFVTGSLLYAASTVGFIVGTLILERLLQQMGRISWSKLLRWLPICSRPESHQDHIPTPYSPVRARHISIAISSIIFSMFFVIMGSSKGYTALFIAYMIAAFARSILTGSLNPYFSSIGAKHIGYAFSCWSFGGVVAPLICQFIIAKGVHWPYFYYGSLVPCGLSIALLSAVFIPTRQELALERRTSIVDSVSSCSTSVVLKGDNEKSYPLPKPTNIKPENKLKLVLAHPFQWTISIFAGAYFGTETTSQGFIVSYLLRTRNSNPATAGYVPSGFFAGIMIGRIVWGYITQANADISFLHALVFVALAMQLVIWFVDIVPVNAVALVIIGLVFGPMFPASMNMANDIIPADQRLISMAIVSAGSSLGCAIFPFATGVILNSKGLHTLPYCNVALTGALLIFWACLPSAPPQLGVSRWLSRKQQ